MTGTGGTGQPVTNGAEEIFYVHPDHLGMPRVITNEAKQLVWRWDNSDPFGSNKLDEDPDGDGKNLTYNNRLPGQYFDQETGTHYNTFRDYDPANGGRYIEVDPIGLVGGLNVYAYVLGNPLSWVDPMGLANNGPYPRRKPAPCTCPTVPKAPDSKTSCPADSAVDKNIKEAKDHYNPGWLYDQVKNHGPWDYKRQGDGKEYQDYGNFNYGAVTAAMGLPAYVAQNGAGIYQQTNGAAAAGEGIPIIKWPYGDDPSDAEQIERGRQYYKCGCSK